MTVYYSILEEYGLMTLKWSSTLSLEGYFQNIKPFTDLVEKYRIKAVISDLRDLQGMIRLNDLKQLIEKRPIVQDQKYKTVYLIDEPELTAYVHLYSENFNKDQLVYQYCITVEKAISLLSLPLSLATVNELLEKKDNILFTIGD